MVVEEEGLPGPEAEGAVVEEVEGAGFAGWKESRTSSRSERSSSSGSGAAAVAVAGIGVGLSAMVGLMSGGLFWCVCLSFFLSFGEDLFFQ